MHLDWPVVGDLAPVLHTDLLGVLADVGPCTVVAHDPPWSALAARAPAGIDLVAVGSMERAALDARVADLAPSDAPIVGVGGGTALDTAKYFAWRSGRRLLLAPTVLSVDAAFTAEIGIRDDGRVHYVGAVTPELVVVDHAIVGSAPARFNRAGVGDILSCHTALHDWELAHSADAAAAEPWRPDLVALARALLTTLDAAADEIRAVTTDGITVLAEAMRHIGAACRAAGHARFEEGSEHFLAYSYEHATGVSQLHGELIALTTAAMAVVQGNDAAHVVDVARRAGVRAHPEALGISRAQLEHALSDLRRYARAEQLWYSVIDEVDITPAIVADAWRAVSALRTS